MSQEKRNEPIAIVGIGCRFPGADNPSEYWTLLREGKDAINKIPQNRWDVDGLFDPDSEKAGKMVSKWGGFLHDIDSFDWKAFRILPRELRHMDPQHRLLLEVSYEALEDAGLPLEEAAGSRTGVFIGIMWNDYHRLLTNNLKTLNGYTTTGNAVAFAPNRISYTFDFRGPSIAMDCACASSLASVHAACQSIRNGESDMALAGGVNLILSPDVVVMLSKAGLLSPEGRCKTLDEKADGFVLGEGAGIIVLKPASKLRASDHVYAFIRGSAVNHNGRNEWIMAVNREAQRNVITDAIRNAEIRPEDIDYVELHGTALPKGDALEVNALKDAIRSTNGQSRKTPCALGSVKSNIGHTESAAGIAGVIKVALSMHNNEIPATLHINKLNPDIDLENDFVVQKSRGPWPSKNRPSIAGVTAIALTGANAHVLLENAGPQGDKISPDERTPSSGTHLFLLSAYSKESLNKLAESYVNFLSGNRPANASIQNICYTLAVRRSHHKYRLAVLGKDRSAIRESLQKYLQKKESPEIFSNTISADRLSSVEPELLTIIKKFKKTQDASNTILPYTQTKESGDEYLMKALAILHTEEYKVDWKSFYNGIYQTVPLPVYQWHRQRFWLTDDEQKDDKNRSVQKDAASHEAEDDKSKSAILLKLKNMPENRQEEIIAEYIRELVLKILGLGKDNNLGFDDRLFDAGLDSIGVVELTNKLRAELGITFSTTTVFNYPNIASLANYLVQVLAERHEKTATATSQDEYQPAGKPKLKINIEDLSEEEAEALLMAKIREAKGVANE